MRLLRGCARRRRRCHPVALASRASLCFLGLVDVAGVASPSGQRGDETCSAEFGCEEQPPRLSAQADSSCGAVGSSCGLEMNATSWMAPGEFLQSLPGKSSPAGKFVAVLQGSQLRVVEASNPEVLWAAPAGTGVRPFQSEPSRPAPLTAARISNGKLHLESANGVVWSTPDWSVPPPVRLFLRFTVLATRAAGHIKHAGTQLSEFKLFKRQDDGSTTPVNMTDLRIESEASRRDHPALMLTDNSIQSKWCSFPGHSLSSGGHVQVDITFPRFEYLDSFSFVTANDEPSRDPTQWRVEGSVDGVEWVLMHAQIATYEPPMRRFTDSEKFPFGDEWHDFVEGKHAKPSDPAFLVLSNKGRLVLKHSYSGTVLWSSQIPRPLAAPYGTEIESSLTDRFSTRCADVHSCEACVKVGCVWCRDNRLCIKGVKAAEARCKDETSRLAIPNDEWLYCANLDQLRVDAFARRWNTENIVKMEQRLAEIFPVKALPDPAKESHATLELEANISFTASEDVAPELVEELLERAQASDSRHGLWPYKVLKLEKEAPTAAIRKAYRKLSLKFHPDKWAKQKEGLRKAANMAFNAIRAAWDTIGPPDKRRFFDSYVGSDHHFNEQWGARTQDWNRQWKGDEDFHFGNPLIATLGDDLWDTKVIGETIWVIEFYTAWCKGCKYSNDEFETVAKKLAHLPVEIASVNCVRNPIICKKHVGVVEYPSVYMINRKFGMQEYFKVMDKDTRPIRFFWDLLPAKLESTVGHWVRMMKDGRVHWDLSPVAFEDGGSIAKSKAMWVVAFVDSPECKICKSVVKELLQLSYSFRGWNAEVGLVDCSLPDWMSKNYSDRCTKEHGVPQPSFRPYVKGFPAGDKNGSDVNLTMLGQLLYNPNEFDDPKVAFSFMNRSIRLALADRPLPVDAEEDKSRALVLPKGPARGLVKNDMSEQDVEVVEQAYIWGIFKSYDEYVERKKFWKVEGRGMIVYTRRRRSKALAIPDTSPPWINSPALVERLLKRSEAAARHNDWSPYRVLDIKCDVAFSTIRFSYRDLVHLFHPDKWSMEGNAEWTAAAEAAHNDLTKAWDMIGTPDKRHLFDQFEARGDSSGIDFRHHWDAAEKSEKALDSELYFGDALITSLNDDNWDRSLTGGTIWLIEFYTSWCTKCRANRHMLPTVAKNLEHLPVEFGAVNCMRNPRICKEHFSISEFPTVKVLNRRFGLVESIKIWDVDERRWMYEEMPATVADIAIPWNLLLQNTSVHWDMTQDAFATDGTIASSSAFWVVAFLDGPDRTDEMREILALALKVATLPVEVGTVNCLSSSLRDFCQKEHSVPRSQRRPLVKVWPSGRKSTKTGELVLGEVLALPEDDVRPEEVFQFLGRTLRLALGGKGAGVKVVRR